MQSHNIWSWAFERSEGQPCDFTLLRVFTWGKQRQRYETAFVDSSLCGKLPVHISRSPEADGEAAFTFEDLSSGCIQQRAYNMHQTVVRRVRKGCFGTAKRKAKPHG